MGKLRDCSSAGQSQQLRAAQEQWGKQPGSNLKLGLVYFISWEVNSGLCFSWNFLSLSLQSLLSWLLTNPSLPMPRFPWVMLCGVTGTLQTSSPRLLDPGCGLTQHPLRHWHGGSCVTPGCSLGVSELLQIGSEDFYLFLHCYHCYRKQQVISLNTSVQTLYHPLQR